MIEPCKRHIVLVLFSFLLAVSLAHAQRAAVGIDVGETKDKFGGLTAETTALTGVNGDFIVLKGNQKEGNPSLVAGAEIRFPVDTGSHATEFAAYVGPMFHFGKHFSAGFHVQVRKILTPPSTVNNQVFARYSMMLLESPAVFEYKFSTAPRHAYLQAEISPEFTPRYKAPTSGSGYPHPILEHGYYIRGTAGYVVGKWYARATYETRYFHFSPSLGNPSGLANWRTDAVTGGIGIVF